MIQTSQYTAVLGGCQVLEDNGALCKEGGSITTMHSYRCCLRHGLMLSQYITCNKCNGLLPQRDAVTLESCGHMVCTGCIQTTMCPVCATQMDAIQATRLFKSQLDPLATMIFGNPLHTQNMIMDTLYKVTGLMSKSYSDSSHVSMALTALGGFMQAEMKHASALVFPVPGQACYELIQLIHRVSSHMIEHGTFDGLEIVGDEDSFEVTSSSSKR